MPHPPEAVRQTAWKLTGVVVAVQPTFDEIAEYRLDADRCRKLSLDASELRTKLVLLELSALLTTLADDLEGRHEQSLAAHCAGKRS